MKNHMKKLLLVSLVLALSGCASYRDPMTFTRTTTFNSEDYVRNCIIRTAQKNHWGICDIGNNTFLVDMNWKKWKLFANVEYTPNSITVTPELDLITLKDEQGKVHRSINNLSKMMSNLINQSFYNMDKVLEPIPVSRCKKFESVETIQGGNFIINRRFSNIAFAWEDQPVKLPETTNFTLEIVPNDQVPEELMGSVHERLEQFLSERGLADDKTNKPYHLKITFKDYDAESLGAVGDFFLHTGSKDLMVEAEVSDPDKKPICYAYITTKSEEGGWTGIIHKASNSLTRNLANDLLNILEIKLMGKNIELKR